MCPEQEDLVCQERTSWDRTRSVSLVLMITIPCVDEDSLNLRVFSVLNLNRSHVFVTLQR